MSLLEKKTFTLQVQNILKYFIFILLMGNMNPKVMSRFECVPKTSYIGSCKLRDSRTFKRQSLGHWGSYSKKRLMGSSWDPWALTCISPYKAEQDSQIVLAFCSRCNNTTVGFNLTGGWSEIQNGERNKLLYEVSLPQIFHFSNTDIGDTLNKHRYRPYSNNTELKSRLSKLQILVQFANLFNRT